MSSILDLNAALQLLKPDYRKKVRNKLKDTLIFVKSV